MPTEALPEILEYEAEMETIRNNVFEKNTHIIADRQKADPSYFKNPKYKTPEDVLRKKKKTCMSFLVVPLNDTFKKPVLSIWSIMKNLICWT